MRIYFNILLVLFVFLSFNSLANDAEQYKGMEIYRIELFGNKVIQDDRIYNLIAVREGEKFDHEILKKDLRNLYKTEYFYKIDLLSEIVNDKLLLVFRFEENPILSDLRLQGNDKLSDNDILDVLPIQKGKLTSRDKLEMTKSIVKQFYLMKGFNKVQVEEKITPVGQGSIQYELDIVEGDRGYVKGIVLKGSDQQFYRDILKRLETKTKWVFSGITGRGRLSEDIINLDRSNIRSFYLDNGFVNVKVSKPRIDYIESKDGYLVVFDVEEGDRYKVGTITFAGDLLDDKDLSDYTTLDESIYFNLSKMQQDIENLTIVYGDESYAFANIDPIFNQDDDLKQISIKYNMEKGEKYKVNKISIFGNTRTRDKVIRREIKIKEQDPYSGTKIKASKRFINRRGFFESVDIKEIPSKDKPNYLDVEVTVEEKPTGYFSIQGGYSSVEALLLGVQVQENNLWGYGKQLGASITVGTVSQNFLIDYGDPYFLDTSYQFKMSLFRRQYEYIDYDRERWGGTLMFGKELNTWTFADIKYRYENIKVDDLTTEATEIFQERNDKISSVSFGIRYDTRDNFLDPTRGISTGLSIEESNSYFGANLHFTEYTGKFSKYFQVTSGHTMAYSFESAFIDFRNTEKRLIVSERYYLGGPENLRGYKFARVSPRRTLSNGEFVRIGGNKYVYSTLEYLYPLATETGLKGILFVDVGQVYEQTEVVDKNPWDMKKDIGFGFRWLSPVGPLKLDFGFPLGNRKSDESKYEVQFSFGSVF